jgi:hypothetical protein
LLQENEIKNGRLAMVAFLGFIAQHAATGKVRILPRMLFWLRGFSHILVDCPEVGNVMHLALAVLLDHISQLF